MKKIEHKIALKLIETYLKDAKNKKRKVEIVANLAQKMKIKKP